MPFSKPAKKRATKKLEAYILWFINDPQGNSAKEKVFMGYIYIYICLP